MADIVLSGYYGFGNAGDEAMLLSILESLKKECPEYSVLVISERPQEIKRLYGVDGIHRFDFIGMVGAFRKAKLLLSGGGSLLQDVTSHRSIFYYLGVLKLAQMMNVPTMLYAQGIGPVVRPMAQKALRQVVNQVKLITVRDERSKEELVRLGVVKPEIHVTADPVLSLEPVGKEMGREILGKSGYQGKKPLIGFAIREWSQQSDYLKEVAEAADQIIRKNQAEVAFLPMQWPEDGDAARKVQELMQEKAILVEGEFLVQEHLSCISNLDLLVGVRLHGLIFSFISDIPSIGISYDPKIDSFLKLVDDAPISTLKNLKSAELVSSVEKKLKSGVEKETEKQEELREASRMNGRYVASLLSELY